MASPREQVRVGPLERREPAAAHEHHHRDVQGGAARAAVFGVSDGLLTNVALILGVAGANPAPGVVRLAGLASLVGGAFSMAAGEYVSMSAQSELIRREVAAEKEELRRNPDVERRELVALYVQRGVPRETAEAVAEALSRDPKVALEVHAREELGINPDQTGSPMAAAMSSFLSFAVGALIPLLPWFFAAGSGAVVASIITGGLMALAVGAAVGYFTDRSMVISALRQLLIAAAAGAVTFGVGTLVGIHTT